MAELLCTAQTFAACGLLDGRPCALCQQYTSLEAEIQAAKAQILAVERAILEAQTKQQDLRAKFNHIHDPVTSRLPPEIISKIFKSTLTRKCGMGYYAYTIDSPLFLGAVCRSWRNIAWSSPSLWNWIHIHLQSPVPESVAEQPKLVEEWFDRSGELPLTIYISCEVEGVDQEDVDEFLEGNSRMIAVFVNLHSERWKNVNIACPLSLMLLFPGNPLGAPNLEMLTLLPRFYGYETHFVLKGPAQPSHVTLCYSFKGLNIAWNHVTNVDITHMKSPDCIRLIQQAPRLVHCKFAWVDDDEEDVPSLIPRDVFVHESVQTLEFNSFKSEHEEQFFDHFSFPRLTNLTIRLYMGSSPVSLLVWENSIRPFITRSCQQLSSLALLCPCKSEFLLQALGTIPTLRTLRLDSCLDLDGYSLFDLLGRTRISRTPDGVENGSLEEFLPNLRAFHYEEKVLWSTSPWSKILDIFGPLPEIGNPHRRPLDNLVVKGNFGNRRDPIIDSESLRRFLDLVDAGISLQLMDIYGRKDLIKLSMAHHGIDRHQHGTVK